MKTGLGRADTFAPDKQKRKVARRVNRPRKKTHDDTAHSPLQVRPEALVPGDTVFVIAPGSAISRDVLEKGLADLRALGFNTKYRRDILDNHAGFAGTEDRRRCELLEAITDKETKGIWAARGGYGSAYLLESLTPQAIRRANKWLIGFSDVTALHSVWTSAGVASLHGAVLSVLGTWSEQARTELLDYLSHRTRPHILLGRTARAGLHRSVRGVLTGGNITLLRSLVGTPQMPIWKNHLVLLEDVGGESYRVDRSILQLLQAGAFDGVAGIILGQLTDTTAPLDPVPMRDRVLHLLRSRVTPDVPILEQVSVGHEASSRPVLLGCVATLLAPSEGSAGWLKVDGHSTSTAVRLY